MSHAQVVHYIEDIAHEIHKEKRRNKQRKDGESFVDGVSITQRLRWFLTNLDSLIIFKTRYYGIASFENLMGLFCRNFKIEKACELLVEQTLIDHINQFTSINLKYPYPIWAEKLVDSNYLTRYEAIVKLKTETIKKLKDILVGKIELGGSRIDGVVQDVSPSREMATLAKVQA